MMMMMMMMNSMLTFDWVTFSSNNAQPWFPLRVYFQRASVIDSSGKPTKGE